MTLDPALATRESELQLVSLLYDPLFLLGPDGRPRPHLVEGQPEISVDGKSWRLQLRQGVLAGARALTAADAAASLRRLKRGPSGWLLAAVRSIEVEGTATLVLHLTRATPTLAWLLAAPAAGISAQLRAGGLAGSGPFKLQGRTPSAIVLRANPTHFAGRPYLDELRFSIFDRASAEVATFQVGTLQLSLHGAAVFGGKPRYATAELEGAAQAPVYLALGRGKPYLQDPSFRLALLKGIDRRRLGRLATLGRSEIADSPVCARLLRGGPPRVAFDRAAANRLLARVAAAQPAMRSDASGGRLKLSLLVDASRFDDSVAAGQLVADLDRLGIAATIEARPGAEYQARLDEGRFELALGRQPVQVPLGPVALGAALAAAGDRAGAARCLAGSCGAKEAAAFMKRLPLIPLVHTGPRVFHDARLGWLRLSAAGLISYADLHWVRRP